MGDRHKALTGAALASQQAELEALRAPVQAIWGRSLSWQELAELAGLPRESLKLARRGRSFSARERLQVLPTELKRVLDRLPRNATPADAAALLAQVERSCFTCAHSPPYPGSADRPPYQGPAGCAELSGGPGDWVIMNYGEYSGCYREDNTTPGWPMDRVLHCPCWAMKEEQ